MLFSDSDLEAYRHTLPQVLAAAPDPNGETQGKA
jgi:hypothetical protein